MNFRGMPWPPDTCMPPKLLAYLTSQPCLLGTCKAQALGLQDEPALPTKYMQSPSSRPFWTSQPCLRSTCNVQAYLASQLSMRKPKAAQCGPPRPGRACNGLEARCLAAPSASQLQPAWQHVPAHCSWAVKDRQPLGGPLPGTGRAVRRRVHGRRVNWLCTLASPFQADVSLKEGFRTGGLSLEGVSQGD